MMQPYDDRQFHTCDRVVGLPGILQQQDILALYLPKAAQISCELRNRQTGQILNSAAWPYPAQTPIYLIPHDNWRDGAVLTLATEVANVTRCSCGDGRNARPCGHRVQLHEYLSQTPFPDGAVGRMALPETVYCWRLQADHWYPVPEHLPAVQFVVPHWSPFAYSKALQKYSVTTRTTTGSGA